MSLRSYLAALLLGFLLAGHDEAVAGQSHGNNQGGGHADRSGGGHDSSNRENYWQEQAAKTKGSTPANGKSAAQPWSSMPPRQGGYQIETTETPRPQDRQYFGYRYYQYPSAQPPDDDLRKLRKAVNGELQELAEPVATLTQPPEMHEGDPKPQPPPPLVVPKYYDPDKPAKENNF